MSVQMEAKLVFSGQEGRWADCHYTKQNLFECVQTRIILYCYQLSTRKELKSSSNRIRIK